MEGEYMNCRSVNFRKSNNLLKILKILLIFTVIISLLTTTTVAAASDLDEFEKAATSEKAKEQSDEEDDKKDKKDEDDKLLINLSEDDEDDSFLGFIVEGFFKVVFGTFFSMIGDGTRMSLARIEGDEGTDAGVEMRRTGEATLPFFQYDHRYLRVNSDIDARDNGLEIGYGPYAFSCRHTKFSEDDPSDELTLIQYHLLARISRTGSAEYGLGLGSLVMRGNDDHSGFSLTFPVKIYPNDSFGVRFRPTFSWIKGNSINEYDLSLVYTIRYASIQLGYRFLEANGEELNGSYLGLAAHY